MTLCSGNNTICRNLIRSIFAIPIAAPTSTIACLTNTAACRLKLQIQARHLSEAAVQALKRDKDISGIVYETEKKIYYLKHNVNHYNKIIGNYVKHMKHSNQLQLHIDYTLNRMKEKGIEPSEHTYLLAVLGLARQRHKMPYQRARLERWFYEFLTLQLKKPKPFNNLKKALLAISHYGHPNLKEMFLAVHQAYPELDVECWNAALVGSMKAQTPEKAQQLFDMARTLDKVDADTYYIMIRSYLHLGDLPSAKTVFATMMVDKKYTADNRFYRAFLHFYAKSIPNEETFMTMEKLWQAVLATTKEEEKISLKLVKVLLRYYHVHGQLAYAEQIFLDLRARQQTLDRKCVDAMYSIIGRFCRRRQLKSAISLYYEMLAEGYPINNTALFEVITASKATNDLQTAQNLVEMILQLDTNAKISKECKTVLRETKRLQS